MLMPNTPSTKTADPDDAGLSLLEMLVVLAILAAAAAITVPNLRSPTAAIETQLMARDLASHLRAARVAAIGRGQAVTVRFDAEKRQYRADDGTRIVSWPPRLELKLTTARLDTRDAEHPVIRFFADGSSSGGSIDLAGDDRKARITVDWLTGTVRHETAP